MVIAMIVQTTLRVIFASQKSFIYKKQVYEIN